MYKHKLFLFILLLLLSCKPQVIKFDTTQYDLYHESQFANGFALIKDNYGRLLEPNPDKTNYATGIIHSSVMFGEMDLLNIKNKL